MSQKKEKKQAVARNEMTKAQWTWHEIKRNKAAYKALRASLKYHGLDDSTPARRGFMACGDTIQQIQNEPQGIAIQKMFNERIAERFGLIYEYNK